MEIEMFVCFQDETWDTIWVTIPSSGIAADIAPGPKRRPWDEEAIKFLARDQVMKEFGEEGIAFFGVLPEFEQSEDEEELEENEEYDDEYGEESEEEKAESDVSLVAILIMVLIIVAVLFVTREALQ